MIGRHRTLLAGIVLALSGVTMVHGAPIARGTVTAAPAPPASPAQHPSNAGSAKTDARQATNDDIHGGRADQPGTTDRPGANVSLAPVEPKTASTLRTALLLSLMAFLPAILICTTSFTRFVVVLSMIRHGLGMPETPPNQVLLSLALFLTMFSMAPTFEAINGQALQPFLSGTLTANQAAEKGSEPLRAFMLRQVHDQDIKAVYDMAHQPLPDRAADVGFMKLVPAFMLNELRVAFRIGFVILLPFLLIDIVVSSILLALGMLMVPPSTLSLPVKVLMFVLIDGWSLVLQGVVGSIH
jgi:flagellar biosynthesis protein FliP